jgi:hypothetical protein
MEYNFFRIAWQYDKERIEQINKYAKDGWRFKLLISSEMVFSTQDKWRYSDYWFCEREIKEN